MAYMQFSRPEKNYALSKKNIMGKLFENPFPKEMIVYVKHLLCNPEYLTSDSQNPHKNQMNG